jgi:hypothetical protein
VVDASILARNPEEWRRGCECVELRGVSAKRGRNGPRWLTCRWRCGGGRRAGEMEMKVIGSGSSLVRT